MKLFKSSIMLTVHINYLLLLLSLFASVCSFPATPLNERNQEISWEAWLLVDDQNQNRQVHDGQIPRRRITPKSVFVAPTFSPENLPPCAEGYSSDPMGRCVKIIKLDEARHLDFLMGKLSAKFGSSIDYETMLEIDDPNSEPTRLDIPFSADYGDDYSNDPPQEELDVAIIVTPTTRESDKSKTEDNSKLDKRDDDINENIYEKELKKLLQTTPTTKKYGDATLHVDTEHSTVFEPDESPAITTHVNTQRVTEDITTVQTAEETDTTTFSTTTDKHVEEATTFKEDSSFESLEFSELNADTTTTASPSTTLEGTTDVPTSTDARLTPKITTTTPKITTYHPVATTYHPYFDLSHLGNTRTKNLVKFPDEEIAVPRSHPDGSYVRFPDVDTKFQQESLFHHTRDVEEQTGNFFNEIVTPQPSQRVHEMVLPPKAAKSGYFSGFNHNQKSSGGFYPKFFPSGVDPASHAPLLDHQYQTATTERLPIKKTKDKQSNFFLLPPKWSSEDRHKPIVLRFSRKHFNLDTNKFKNGEFYRSLPMEDLTYLFGYKNGQSSHR